MRPDLHGKRERLLRVLSGRGMTLEQAKTRGFSKTLVERLARDGKVIAVANDDGLDRARVFRAVESR